MLISQRLSRVIIMAIDIKKTKLEELAVFFKLKKEAPKEVLTEVEKIAESFPEEVRKDEALDVIKTEAQKWVDKSEEIKKTQAEAVKAKDKAGSVADLAGELFLLKRQSQISIKNAEEAIAKAKEQEEEQKTALSILTAMITEDLTLMSDEDCIELGLPVKAKNKTSTTKGKTIASKGKANSNNNTNVVTPIVTEQIIPIATEPVIPEPNPNGFHLPESPRG